MYTLIQEKITRVYPSSAVMSQITVTHARRRESLADRAYRVLREQILANELPPGYRGLEEELALRLKMSRTPVREALVRLQLEGLVQIQPRHGVLVQPIAMQDMHEIYQVVTAIETAAVELLARRRLTEEELTPVREAVDAMDKALARDDRVAWAAADTGFHRLLLELCGNARLASIGLAHQDQVRRTRNATLGFIDPPHASNVAHRRTYEAIRVGEAVLARELHRTQREGASQNLTGLLEVGRNPGRKTAL
jgi:DNA-binding GntR family transcriptional regulator